MSMYCTKCRVFAYRNHKCTDSDLIPINKELKDVVNRLYDLGITLLSASWSAYPVFNWTDEFNVYITLDLRKQLNQVILGDLPTGWKYYWETITPDHSEVYIINYYEKCSGFDFESIKDHVKSIIQEFEDYLDTRDCEAVKALLLLTSS